MKRRNRPITDDAPLNEYFETVSRRFGIAQVILYLSLFAFVVLSFFSNTELITYRNFYYFFKDLNASAETVDLFGPRSLSYPTDSVQSFSVYRKGLAVAGNTSVTVFSSNGRQTVSRNINYQNPVSVGSGKYLLVYEIGGTQYSVYNSYTQIYAGKSDRPITGAAVSDSGRFALVTSSDSGRSSVSLYSDRFELLNRYNRSGYVMDVSISPNGNRIAILTSSTSGGAFSTVLTIAEVGKTESRAEVDCGSAAGLRCAFSSSGNISILCGDRTLCVNSSGKILNQYDFPNGRLLAADCNGDGVALCVAGVTNDLSTLAVFDGDGKREYEQPISGMTGQPILRVGDGVFWLLRDGVSRLDLSGGGMEVIPCDTTQKKLLAVTERQVWLCSPMKAESVLFD